MAGPWPELDPAIEVHPSAGDLAPLWDRFEVFEAIHHSQRICNPMNGRELDEMVRAMRPGSAGSWLDLGCGSGETLLRATEAGARNTVGVDLSPWMLNAAGRESAVRLPTARHPRWVLGEAAAWPSEQRYERVSCLGADWIWHGMQGTVRQLKARVVRGGRVAYGGARLHLDADPERVAAELGQLDTIESVERTLASFGLRPVVRIDVPDEGWVDYLAQGRADVAAWARAHPGPRADRWIAEQQDWWEHFERDRAIVGWSVWVAKSISP